MLRERIIWIVALVLVGGLGFFSGETIGVRDGQQGRTTAIQQFFSQRGGQAGGQGGNGGGFRNGNGGANGGGTGGGVVAGTVSTVSGDTVTVTMRNGQTAQVQLASGGAVHKQADGQISDIKAGDQIVAMGAQNGTNFQATSIQIGGLFGGQGGGRGGQGGGQGGRGGAATPTPGQ